MTIFDEREDAFESKFAHDEDLKFKAQARRNRLLGLWAAEKLGKTHDAASAYAKDLVATGFSETGDNSALRKVVGDLAALGISEQLVRHKMTELLDIAAEQIKVGQ